MPWDERYEPIALLAILNPMLEHYLKLIPTYNAENKRTTKDHLDVFKNFVDYFYIEHEYVYMRIFVQYHDGSVWKWFITLPPDTIHSWHALESTLSFNNGVKRKIPSITCLNSPR